MTLSPIFLLSILYSHNVCFTLRWCTVWPDWAIFKVLRHNFCLKSCQKTFGGFFFGQRLEKLGYFLILHPVALMTYLFYPFQFALSYSLSRLPKKLTSQNFFPHIWRKKVHTPSLTHPLTHPPTHTHPLTHPQLAFKPFFIPPTFFLAFKPFLLFIFASKVIVKAHHFTHSSFVSKFCGQSFWRQNTSRQKQKIRLEKYFLKSLEDVEGVIGNNNLRNDFEKSSIRYFGNVGGVYSLILFLVKN